MKHVKDTDTYLNRGYVLFLVLSIQVRCHLLCPPAVLSFQPVLSFSRRCILFDLMQRVWSLYLSAPRRSRAPSAGREELVVI